MVPLIVAGGDVLPDLGHGAQAPFVLPPLPYAETALAPVVSARTVGVHYHKHHAGYLATLNRLLHGHALAGASLVTVIRESAKPGRATAMFNAAAQVWNHDFYWRSLMPGGGGRPGGRLGAAIDRDFGGFVTFRERLAEAAVSQFGSGWAWLCLEGERLTIRQTANAGTPIQQPGVTALLTIDVWEHAYYLDTQNRRAEYVGLVIDRLLNWTFAAGLFEARMSTPSSASRPTGGAPEGGRPSIRTGDTRAATFSRLARRG